MWKNIVELGKTQMTRSRIRVAYWITEATNTRSEYVMLIAFPLQQWLGERATVFRCLSCLLYSLKGKRVSTRSRRISRAAGSLNTRQ